MTKPAPYLAIVPVEGTDALTLADVLQAAQRQWSRLGVRGFLPAAALELSQLADLGPCWVVRNPAASAPAPLRVPTPPPTDVARAVAQADRTSPRPQAPPRAPSGPRLAYSSASTDAP